MPAVSRPAHLTSTHLIQLEGDVWIAKSTWRTLQREDSVAERAAGRAWCRAQGQAARHDQAGVSVNIRTLPSSTSELLHIFFTPENQNTTFFIHLNINISSDKTPRRRPLATQTAWLPYNTENLELS